MRYKALGGTSAKVSAIGQGAGIGGYTSKGASYAGLAAIIRSGIELGMTFIDTAPVYGDGQAEEAVGEAIRGWRERVFVASKVSPENLSYEGVMRSLGAGLSRLKTDYIDLYQVHWSNPRIPIAETMRAMSRLVEEGKVRYVGVCNFSLKELREAQAALPSEKIVSAQVEYNLYDRSIESHILPYCQQHQMTVIAYSPLHRGQIASGARQLGVLQEIGQRHQKTAAQVALAWLIAHAPVVAIPNTTSPQRVKENASSADFQLREEDIQEINSKCTLKQVDIPTPMIRVRGQEGSVYQTLEEAVRNPLGFVPSPAELAEQIRSGEFLKPVRLVQAKDSSGQYEVVEGRIRYWAWVIAHQGKLPVPALIEESG